MKVHQNSSFILPQKVIPTDSSTMALLHFDGHLLSTKGLAPNAGSVYTFRDDAKFGKAIAIEEGTTNTAASSVQVYTHPSVVQTTSITTLSETYLGSPIYRITYTPSDDTARDHYRANYNFHGASFTKSGGGNFSFVVSTPYAASIYWRCSKPSVSVNGSPSNIAGWGGFTTISTNNSWKRSMCTINPSSNLSDIKYWGINDPTINTGETITVDWCCPQMEQKAFITSYVATTRSNGILQYPSGIISNALDLTISMWIKPNAGTDRADRAYSLISTGNDYTQTFMTLWNYYPLNTDDVRKFTMEFGNDNNSSRQYHDLNSSIAFTTTTWEMLTITFCASTKQFKFFRNGVYWDQYTASKVNPVSYFRISQPNFIIDELRIDKIIRTDDDILQWYLATSPFYDRSEVPTI